MEDAKQEIHLGSTSSHLPQFFLMAVAASCRSLQHISKTAITLALLATATGCAGISSTRVEPNNSVDGLIYFLPKRDIYVAVVKPDADKTPLTITVQPSDAKPDLTNAYVARIPRSQVGTAKATIQVNTTGLLHSDTSSSLTSSLSDLAKALGGTVGTLHGLTQVPRNESQQETECKPGTYSKLLELYKDEKGAMRWRGPDTFELCGVTFKLHESPNISALPKESRTALQSSGSHAGLFYRVALPYVVSATQLNPKGPPVERQFLIFSPSGSPTYFLPVARAAFANNDASFTFDNGVPTKYGQTIQSELNGLVALPATFVDAYFKAIGNIFGERKDSLTGEKAYLDALSALTIAQVHRERCLTAIAAGDKDKIAAACAQ